MNLEIHLEIILLKFILKKSYMQKEIKKIKEIHFEIHI